MKWFVVVVMIGIPVLLNMRFDPNIQKAIQDITLLSQIVTAECGICDTAEKRLVASTVLNRTEHPDFPKTVLGVLEEDNQFHGYLSKHYVDKNRGVAAEVYYGKNRNYKVLFFFHKNSRKKLNIPVKILFKLKEHWYATSKQ